jgi:hypothetical protein
MDLLEMHASWKSLGVWIQLAFIIGLIGTVASIISLVGVPMLSNIIIPIFILGFWLLFYGNLQQSKKLAKANKDLGEVDNKINQAIAAVYAHKNQEIKDITHSRDLLGSMIFKLTNISLEDVENEISRRKSL